MGFDLVSERPSDAEPQFPTDDPDSRHEYFRFNGAGMAAICMALHSREALDDLDLPECPELPGPEDEHFDEDEQPLTEAARAYMQDLERMLTFHRLNGKIPWYKFNDNSGWLVTPEECIILSNVMAGLALDDTAKICSNLSTRGGGTPRVFSPEESSDTLEALTEFGQFAQACVALGGFRVY